MNRGKCGFSAERIESKEVYILRMHPPGKCFGAEYSASIVVEYDDSTKTAHARSLIGSPSPDFIRMVHNWVENRLGAEKLEYERIRKGKITRHEDKYKKC